MKLTDLIKKIKKFDPLTHWYIILFIFSILTLVVIFYSIYSFFYIKGEIFEIEQEAKNSVSNSDSTNRIINNNFLNNVNNLNKNLENFENKETEYNRLIKSTIPSNITSTTSATTTTVATSTE